MNFEISPSLAAGSLLNLGETLGSLTGLDHIHLDIDDGNFVHGITFGTNTVRAVTQATSIPLDVHLEVLNPLAYVQDLGEIGISALCAHVEALDFPSEFIGACKNAGIDTVGLALNIKTPIETILPYAADIDYLLLVSVEADCRGLQFCQGVLDKARHARAILPKTCSVWMDGAINQNNLAEVVATGIDGIVVGRAVFGTPNPVEAYHNLKHYAEELQKEYA